METQVVVLRSSKGIRASDVVTVFQKGDCYSIPAVSEELMKDLLYSEHAVDIDDGREARKRIGVKKVVLEDLRDGERHVALALCLGCRGKKVMRGRVFGPPFLILPWKSLKSFENDLVLFDFYYFRDNKVERFAVVLSNFVDVLEPPQRAS